MIPSSQPAPRTKVGVLTVEDKFKKKDAFVYLKENFSLEKTKSYKTITIYLV